MILARPVGAAVAPCAFFPDEQRAAPQNDEQAEVLRRLHELAQDSQDLKQRVRYIEERLSIVRREEANHGVEGQ